ncbi:hypothetical protein Tco_1289561, partial [Tanacetum coccineum]
MSSITAQQTKLDLELVPKEKRLEIGKCNGRLNPGKTQREPTFQVVLDALALTPCYSAFLTTTDVPEVYMHQFWDSIQNHDTSYRTHSDPDLYLQYKMSGEEPAPQMAPVESPQMISTVELPILKKGEYTLWSMRME